jgi:hypothetical protein
MIKAELTDYLYVKVLLPSEFLGRLMYHCYIFEMTAKAIGSSSPYNLMIGMWKRGMEELLRH